MMGIDKNKKERVGLALSDVVEGARVVVHH
jgi:hypothetical protein